MSGLPALDIETNEEETEAPSKSGEKVVDIFSRGRGKKSLTEQDRQQLVIDYRLKARKLGRSILRKWHARMDLEEVDSIVDLSLCEAVKRFDPTRGASFMTFLYYHLKGNLIRAVSAAATANVIPGHENDPDTKSKEDESKSVVNAMDVAEALCNHDRPLPDEALFKKQLVRLSKQACSRLDPLEREVIERIYLGGQQLMDIANNLGYSRCHISRVKKKALETLNQDMSQSLELEGERVGDVRRITRKLSTERRAVHRRRPRSRKARRNHRLSEEGSDQVVNG